MGKLLVAAALLCASFAANAGKLVVDYSGVVSSIDRASSLADMPPYSVGDPIAGRLVIDTTFAPADRVASDPSVGRYYGGSPSLDFILGAPHPRGNASSDLLLVYNDWDPPSTGAAREDGIIINDSSGGIDGEFNLLLGFRRPNPLGQVFADDSLSQSFVVERESGTNLWGYIERGFGEFRNVVDFTLDRLSVKPLVCRAP
jgi:hypothetical protein